MVEITDISIRGRCAFQVSNDRLLNSAANVQKLRSLWQERRDISGEALGPGDPGDFDHGAWHIACHMVAAAGVLRGADKGLLWMEVSHDALRDRYFASVTGQNSGETYTVPLDSAEGRGAVAGSSVLGFVEGNSTGRTSARDTTDSPTAFNLWRRQDFDQPVHAEADGGKVWEHWCTLRDIREGSDLATSVLTAYISLMATLGDAFAAVAARGRREYGHPEQLCAMIEGGLISETAALCDMIPAAIPDAIATQLERADAKRSLRVCELLQWTDAPRYYMYARRIERWLPGSDLATRLRQFRTEVRSGNGVPQASPSL